jgi:hypothetical protein
MNEAHNGEMDWANIPGKKQLFEPMKERETHKEKASGKQAATPTVSWHGGEHEQNGKQCREVDHVDAESLKCGTPAIARDRQSKVNHDFLVWRVVRAIQRRHQHRKNSNYPEKAHEVTSNENKMSDGGRGRASLAVEVWKSSQNVDAERPSFGPSHG